MKQTKVTHLTSAHPRYDTRIFIKECQSLAKFYVVSLVVADGLGDEEKDGIKIYDVGKLEGRMNRIFKTTKKVLRKAIELDSDVYHFHDPELMPIGLKLKKLGKQVIFDIHENTDLQILEKQWIPLLFRKIISKMYRQYEDYICQRFDLLVVPQEAMYHKYTKVSKCLVIGNFPNEVLDLDFTNKRVNKYNLLYSGSVSEARGLWNMLELIVQLVKLDKRYRLTIAGSIESKLLEKAKKHHGWKYIEYLGYLSKDEIYNIYTKNSIGLILFNNVGQYYMAYSLKLFEYMQNGMFVIMPNFGDWINFNTQYKAGYTVPTKQSKEIAKKVHAITMEELIQQGIDNIKSVNKHFSWVSQEKKLFQAYKEIVNVK